MDMRTNEAARFCKVEKRTFKSWAKKLKLNPTIEGGGVYRKEDVEKVALEIKAKRKA